MDINNLSDHEKAMIAVAEGGDPNDPAENKDAVVTLPSDQQAQGKDSQGEPSDEAKDTDAKDVEESEDKSKEDTKDDDEVKDDSKDELTEEQKELAKLRQAARDRAVLDAVGGEESYKELAQWASKELTDDQAAVYNGAINQGSPEQAAFAAKALNSMRELDQIKKYGYQGEVTRPGGNQATQESAGYQSAAQMRADMSDKRYATDPAFRAKVAQKLAATPAGII